MSELTAEQWDEFWSMGDINRDGYINEADQALLEVAWGSDPSWPNWDERCDFNKDGKIDTTDLNIMSSNYGLNIWDYFGVERPFDWMNIAYSAGIGCLIGIIYQIAK